MNYEELVKIKCIAIEELLPRYEGRKEELNEKAELAAEIMQELEVVNNRGLDAKKFKKIVGGSTNSIKLISVASIWAKHICTDKLEASVDKVAALDKIDDVFVRFLYDSEIKKLIFEIYYNIVDQFSKEITYQTCLEYLLDRMMEIKAELDVRLKRRELW